MYFMFLEDLKLLFLRDLLKFLKIIIKGEAE
jgi:hypothetical protein